MDKVMRHRVNAARVAVERQIPLFKNQFGNVASEWKSDDTRVTFADFAISEKIIHELESQFSGDHYCSEESNPMDEVIVLENRYTWILDPIDGTNNFAKGIPFCGISLALLKDGMPCYGFLYDFSREELIEGGKGYGVWVRKKRIKPLNTSELDPKKAVVGFHFPVPEDRFEQMRPFITQFRIRSLGSAALNFVYTACGRLDGAIDFKVKVWDIAAVYAILEGAGLTMRFVDESPFPVKAFHVDGPRLKCFAGSPEFMKFAEQLLQ